MTNLFNTIKLVTNKKRWKLIKMSLKKSFMWTFAIATISLSPILLTYVVVSLNRNLDINLLQIILNGSILFVSLSIAGSAWVDYTFSKVKTYPFIKLISNFVFAIIVGFTAVIFATISSAAAVNSGLLSDYTWILFSVSLIYAFGIKAILILDEILSSMDIITLEAEKKNLYFKIKEVLTEHKKEENNRLLAERTIKEKKQSLELKEEILELRQIVSQLQEKNNKKS